MRAFCILALCIGAALSVSVREKRQTCTEAKLDNVCTQDATGPIHFPHPTAANKFLQCAPGHRMFIITCPEGEIYHHSTTSCDVPQPATSAPAVNPSNPCTPENLAMGLLFFPYASDSTKFIECSPQGQPTVLSCPPRLSYDAGRQSCVFPTGTGSVPITGNTGTGTGSTGTGTGSTGTGSGTGTNVIGGTTGGGLVIGSGAGLTSNPCPKSTTEYLFFPHPTNPSMYIQCDLAGDAYLMRCPANLIWNKAVNQCDSRYAAFQATPAPAVG